MKGRRWAIAALFALLCACGGGPDIPREDLRVRIAAEPSTVEPGKAFSLSVVRSFRADLVPEAWDDKALLPLTVRLNEVRRRERAGYAEETRRYDAYAFSLESITLPAPRIKARPAGGGDELAALGEPVEITVHPALDPQDPGPAELPGGPLPPPGSRWALWLAAAGAMAGAGAQIVRRLRKRKRVEAAREPPGPEAPGEPAEDPQVRALRRLRRLRDLHPASREEIQAYFIEASALVRDFLRERFSLRVRERTTQEILAAPSTAAALPAAQRALAGQVLDRCDLVKFADVTPRAADREGLLDDSERFLGEAGAPARVPGAQGAEGPDSGDASSSEGRRAP